MLRHTDLVEPLSLDEAYLDVTEAKSALPSATAIARSIRAQIREETQLTASAGVAPAKFLAKIASDWRKPDGLFVIRPDDVTAFLAPLPVARIHGVGKVMDCAAAAGAPPSNARVSRSRVAMASGEVAFSASTSSGHCVPADESTGRPACRGHHAAQ